MINDNLAGYQLSAQQQSLWARSPRAVTNCVVTFPAPIDPDRLASAFAEVVRRNEILRTEFHSVPGLRGALQVIGAESVLVVEPIDVTAIRLNAPMLCVDRLGMAALVSELLAAYHGAAAGEEPLQYADYAQWSLDQEPDPEGTRFWSGQPEPAALRLVDQGGSTRSTVEFRLDRAETATLFAAWRTVLAWLAADQEADATVWLLTDGRGYDELDAAIGLYERAVPITQNVALDQRFADLATESARLINAATRHQNELPATWTCPPDSIGLRHLRVGDRSITELTSEPVTGLELTLTEQPDGIAATITADPNRFPALDVAGLPDRLRAVLAQQDRTLDAIDLRTEAERAAAPEGEVREHTEGIQHLVEAVAERTPDATALIMGDARISYRDLLTRAERLSFARGTLVGLLLPPGPDLVAAVIAVWRCGAAFVSLNPEDPSARTAATIERLGCTTVLTEPGNDAGPVHDRTPADADDVAYLALTSGSTGTPRAVMATHAGVLNYFDYLRDTYDLRAEDIVLQHAPSTFDAWLRDCIAPLTVGATVVLTDAQTRRSAEGLLGLIEAHRITRLLHCVPTVLRELTRAAGARDLASVRTILCSGEKLLQRDCADVWSTFGPQVRVVNQYGPTETTLTSTYGPADPQNPGTAVPIGAAIPGTRLAVAGAAGQGVPVGVVGEVVIAGRGVTLGYHGDPVRTATQFVPDPDRPGARRYRTGDRARVLPGGGIEFLGRADHQIKINGVRVELGEIEATLVGSPAVHEAVVVPVPAANGTTRLVAWMTPAGNPDPDAELARAAQLLPAHAVPTELYVRAALPRNPHGKVDRAALAEAAAERLATTTQVSARTGLEEVITGIFAAALKLPSVGPDDDFFRLGGHSLLGTRVAYDIGDALGIRMPLRGIFEARTSARLAELARAVAAEQGAADRVERLHAKAIVRGPELAHYPVSFAQRRVWLAARLHPDDPGNNVPVVLRLTGEVDAGLLRESLNRLVERHEVLRTGYPTVDGEPVQVVHEHVTVELPELDASTEPELAEISRAQVAAPFELTEPPLLRAALVRLGPARSALVIAVHHIAIDEWSVGVLLAELATAYAAGQAGHEPDFGPPPTRYVDFAAWQRRRLTTERLAELTEHWRQTLAGAQFELALPVDHQRPEPPTGRAERVSVPLSRELTDGLALLADEHDGTLFMVLLAAFAILLGQQAGADDVVVGSPVANRLRRETENMVGFFANILVLRTDLTGNPTFGELLARVRDSALDAFDNQDMPFETLVEQLRPDRVRFRMPLVQVWFVLHNTPLPTVEIPGLAIELSERDSSSAKFDLNLALTETPDGLAAALEYSTDLFEENTARRLLRAYQVLLTELVTRGDAATRAELSARIAEVDREERQMAEQQREKSRQASFSKFRAAKATAITMSSTALVSTEPLLEGESMPLVLRPQEGGNVDLTTWIAENRGYLRDQLHKSAALLFRGFRVGSPEEFEAAVRAFSPRTLDYYERSTPRHAVSGQVYTSTEFPPERHIPLHSESAYSYYWPRTLWFCCLTAAATGGATPIADTRTLLERVEPALRAKFAERGVMYVRNYYEGFDIPWQVAFQTEDKGVVADYCREVGMEFEWRDNGTLRTRQVLDAITTHPDTGESLWFNQVHAYHLSSFDPEMREAILRMFGSAELPRDVRFGDGSPIEAAEFEHLAEVYHQATVSFPWRDGDVMLLDNMLAAHGREPYTGARRVVVAMSDPWDRAKLPSTRR